MVSMVAGVCNVYGAYRCWHGAQWVQRVQGLGFLGILLVSDYCWLFLLEWGYVMVDDLQRFEDVMVDRLSSGRARGAGRVDGGAGVMVPVEGVDVDVCRHECAHAFIALLLGSTLVDMDLFPCELVDGSRTRAKTVYTRTGITMGNVAGTRMPEGFPDWDWGTAVAAFAGDAYAYSMNGGTKPYRFGKHFDRILNDSVDGRLAIDNIIHGLNVLRVSEASAEHPDPMFIAIDEGDGTDAPMKAITKQLGADGWFLLLDAYRDAMDLIDEYRDELDIITGMMFKYGSRDTGRNVELITGMFQVLKARRATMRTVRTGAGIITSTARTAINTGRIIGHGAQRTVSIINKYVNKHVK